MKWVSYTRSISSRIGEENSSNTIAEQNERIARYLKKCGCSVSEKYSDRKRTAEATEGFDKLVQDGMARKFDAVVVDSIFRCGRTLPFAIEALQRTFYPLGIQFAVVEDDFCSADKTAEEVAEYFNGKTIDKIRSEFITNRQNHFEEGTLTHRQAKYGYALSEDRRNLVLNPESVQVVKLIFQMYLEDMKIPEIARALDVQGVQTPQVQMAKKKRSRTKNKWQDSTIRSILKNPLYIGKCTLTLAKARRELEVPAIVSKTEFQEAQKKLESTRLPSRKKARKKPNLLFKKIYDKESGKGLLCRTSEDESQQIYSFDKGYRCFSGKAPFIESEKIFREILSALEKEKMQAAHIDRVLDLNPEKVKQCMDAGLLQYRKRANEIVAHLMAKDDERTAVYREYEQGSISLEQVEEYEHQYQVAVQKQEAAFKKVMLAVNDIEKAFSHGNPWLMKFRAISIPEKLERTHLKEWLDHLLMGSNPIIAPDSEMLWNAAIVWRILRRYEYTGALVMGRRKKIDVNTTSVRTLPEDRWIIAENAHAAIVTKDEYYQAQKAIRNVTPIQYKVGDDFALKGKICCGNCNRQLRHERQYGEMVFYCGYKRSAGKFSKCYGGYYREYSVNAKVARAIKTVFYALDVVNQGMQEKQSITVRCMDIEDLEKQAEAIRVEQIKLYESYADGVLRRDVYIEKKKTLSEKLAALQDSIQTEKEEQECADELDEEIRALTKQASEKTYIGGLTKECVDAFVSMVYLYDDQTMKVEFNCEDVIRRALEKYGA